MLQLALNSVNCLNYFCHPLYSLSHGLLWLHINFFCQDEDETDFPSKFNQAEMSQQFMVQLEERVSKILA